MVRSSNVTLALNETKDPYDPSKPNTYEDYVDWKQRQQFEAEEKRQAEAAAVHAAAQIQFQPAKTKPTPNNNKNKPTPVNIAENMMLKMGWKGTGHGTTQYFSQNSISRDRTE